MHGSPALSSDEQLIYVGSEDGKLYAIYTNSLDTTASSRWSFSTGGGVESSPAGTSLLGNIYLNICMPHSWDAPRSHRARAGAKSIRKKKKKSPFETAFCNNTLLQSVRFMLTCVLLQS